MFHKRLILMATVTPLFVSQAFAGGLERGGYSIDQLFDTETFSFSTTGTYVTPQRRLRNAVDTDPSDGLGSDGMGGGTTSTDDTTDYVVARFGIKLGIVDSVDCLFDYGQPWGADTNPGPNWVGANFNIETQFDSNNFSATCSYKFDAGPGQLRFLGGGSYQEISGFRDRLVAPPIPALGTSGIGSLNLADSGHGWRVGVAYEIPEIAFRTSLVYNSQIDFGNLRGDVDLTEIPSVINPSSPFLGRVTPVFGNVTMPQTLELKMQSGIAPDWLAFGSVKWVDWSVLQTVTLCPLSTRGLASCTFNSPTKLTSIDLLFRDGWTLTGGVGHKFNDLVSGAIQLNYDRRTSTGINTFTDTWTVSAGAVVAPNDRLEFRAAGTLGILTSGSSGRVERNGNVFGDDVSYSFNDDFVGAFQLAARVRF